MRMRRRTLSDNCECTENTSLSTIWVLFSGQDSTHETSKTRELTLTVPLAATCLPIFIESNKIVYNNITYLAAERPNTPWLGVHAHSSGTCTLHLVDGPARQFTICVLYYSLPSSPPPPLSALYHASQGGDWSVHVVCIDADIHVSSFPIHDRGLPFVTYWPLMNLHSRTCKSFTQWALSL